MDCACGSPELVLRFELPDGSLVYPIIDPIAGTATVQTAGITTTTALQVPLMLASAVESGDPFWGPEEATTAGGVTILPGGVNGHTPAIVVAAGDGLAVDTRGRLNVDPFDQLSLASARLNDLGDVTGEPQPGDLLRRTANGWEPVDAGTVAAAALGAPSAPPPVPMSGGPVVLTFDPAAGVFAWQTI